MIETYGMVRGFWNTWKDLKINQYSFGVFVTGTTELLDKGCVGTFNPIRE